MNSRRFQSLATAGFGWSHNDRLAQARTREDERWRRARAIGVMGTVALHFLFFILFHRATMTPGVTSAASGPPAGDIRPAGGGSGMTMVEVRPAQAPAPAEVPQPVPVPVEVVEPPPEVEVVAPNPEPGPALAQSQPGVGDAGAGGQGGQDVGVGTAGTGTGDGGGGDGDGGPPAIIPPSPRGIFIPPAGRPASARGQEITVWVFVTEGGRVDRRTVRLEPPTSDSRYNQRLVQSVAEWVFEPARQGGRPVPAWYPFQIIL